MAPRIEACFLSLGRPLPQKKHEPPSENWIMTGRLSFFPASRTALIVLVLVTLKPGIAYPLSLACFMSASRTAPVITPAFIPGISQNDMAAWAVRSGALSLATRGH